MKAAGVDVAKHFLQVCVEGVEVVIGNNKKEIARFLRDLPKEYAIGVESTNSYWWKLARAAFDMGFAVYVLDAVKLKSYRESLPGRGKTDKRDAEVIARYVEREHDKLRRYAPVPEHLRALVNVFRRRMKVVRARVALSMSLSDVPELAKDRKRILACLETTIERMDAAIELRASLLPGYRELMEVTCLGPVTVAGLLTCLERGEFKTADSFVCFLGLDPRPNQSGEREGPRKLTKKGDPYVRAALYMAGLSASGSKLWAPVYRRYRERGLPSTACLVILARKLARVAWAIHHKGVRFDPALAVNPGHGDTSPN